jgi:hypothetical protein
VGLQFFAKVEAAQTVEVEVGINPDAVHRTHLFGMIMEHKYCN